MRYPVSHGRFTIEIRYVVAAATSSRPLPAPSARSAAILRWRRKPKGRVAGLIPNPMFAAKINRGLTHSSQSCYKRNVTAPAHVTCFVCVEHTAMTLITLRVLDGADRGRIFADLPTPVSIGREEGNTIQLNDERASAAFTSKSRKTTTSSCSPIWKAPTARR